MISSTGQWLNQAESMACGIPFSESLKYDLWVTWESASEFGPCVDHHYISLSIFFRSHQMSLWLFSSFFEAPRNFQNFCILQAEPYVFGMFFLLVQRPLTLESESLAILLASVSPLRGIASCHQTGNMGVLWFSMVWYGLIWWKIGMIMGWY